MRLARRTAAVLVTALVIVIAAGMAVASASGMPSFTPKPAKSDAETAPPAEIQALLNLLADPKVQAWIDKQNKAAPAPPPPKAQDQSPQQMMAAHVEAMREHINAMVDVVPTLPAEYAHAGEVFNNRLGDRRPGRIFGAEGLFWLATKRLRRHLEALPVETVGERLRLIAERALFALGLVVAYAVGSIGAFLFFRWPGLLRQIVLGYLIVFLAVRMAAVLGKFLLAPRNERFRVIPMDSAAARFWYVRLKILVGWLVFGLVTRGVEQTLGISPAAVNVVGAVLGFLWLALLLEAIWRRPPEHAGAESRDPGQTRHMSRVKLNALLTFALVVLWGLRVAGAMPAFWLLAVVILWPIADRIARRGVEHVLRPPGATAPNAGPNLLTVALERGFRVVMIIAALAVLAWGWGIDLERLTAQETMMTRLTRGALSAVAIALIADFTWQIARAAIDTKLADTRELGSPNSDEARRRARLHTLLPIFRNVLFVVVVVVAAMMALSALGVEIGPLIAGASVIGVAIGFGAQTIVRDVISGMFYLLDDAFRVGEYIQSGHYKGTVEGFSIRSVRLRHQRGPVFTVPFSLLGAVENMSRDWVIDKMTVGVTYDSDIDLARKLIKQIGQELAADPEFAPIIIEPLKMQGVDAFGDFAIQLRLKMMTLPGQQFMVRRAAFAKIKKAFDANGIKFAYPTVQLAGEKGAGEIERPAAAAIAQEALSLTRPQPAAAE